MSSQTNLFAVLLAFVSLTAASSNFRSWNVTVNHETCLLLQGKITLYVNYPTAGGGMAGPARINVTGPTAQSLANCHLPTANGRMIQIGWMINTTTELSFFFSANKTLTNQTNGNSFVLTGVHLKGTLNGPLPNATATPVNYKRTNLPLAPGFIDHALLCVSGYQQYPIALGFNLSLTNLQIQAFVNRTTYQAQYVCPADQESVDVVPIVIGGILAASVLAVTIGYLVVTARRTPEPLDLQLPFEEEVKKAPETQPSTSSGSDEERSGTAHREDEVGKKY